MSALDRRRLLCGGCAALALAACTGRNYVTDDPEPGDSGPGTGPDPTGPDLDDPLANPDYPCDQPIAPGAEGWRKFEISEHPELGRVGEAIPATSPGGLQYLVVQVEEGCYVAIARRCTHQGALVRYEPDRRQFVCPLHASIFDPDGSVVGGPAPVGLEVFLAGREGDAVWVKITE